MTSDASLIISFIALTFTVFGGMFFYLSAIKLKGSIYRDELSRVELDRSRTALEADIKRMYEEIYRDRGRWEEINHLVLDAAKYQRPRTRQDQENFKVDPERFLGSFGIDIKNVRVSHDQVFILTPLTEAEYSAIDAVNVACRKSGLRAIKGDENKISGGILPVVIKEIVSSRFVIANLNGRNPNVFYEMGIAQALGKDVIMFAHRNNMENIPFDVAQQQIIFYRGLGDLHEKMNRAIAQLGWNVEKK